MLLTTKVHITHNNPYRLAMEKLCFHCARMYNVGMYSVRQHFFSTTKYLSYYENYHCCKTNENYHILMSNTGQQILRLVDRDIKSFFHLLKLKREGKYSEKVRLPHYKGKEDLMTFVTQGDSARRRGDKLRIGMTREFREMYGIGYRYIELQIPRHLLGVKEFKEIRVVPMFGGSDFDIEFVYDSAYTQDSSYSGGKDNYMSIDLGVTNLMACTVFSGSGPHSFVYDGRYIKSINQYYNKQKAAIQSGCDRNGTKLSESGRFRRLSLYRTNKLRDAMSKAAHYVVRKCMEYGVSTLVLGYNQGLKNGVSIGRKNNSNFVMIPHSLLVSKLRYLCELHGIGFEVQEESYTSKASCVDLDLVPVHGVEGAGEVVFSGKRRYRGLYVSGGGVVVNADINGSVNILRKYLKRIGKADLSADSVGAVVRRPVVRVGVVSTKTPARTNSCKVVGQATSFREG